VNLDPDGAKLLCCAMINRALLDMRSRGEGGHENLRQMTYRAYVRAVLWLGSSRSSLYFDYMDGLGQEDALYAMRWADYALELRSDPRANLTGAEVVLLTTGIKSLRKGRRRGIRLTRAYDID